MHRCGRNTKRCARRERIYVRRCVRSERRYARREGRNSKNNNNNIKHHCLHHHLHFHPGTRHWEFMSHKPPTFARSTRC
jgi:diadenosine tetraphosphate (Ap4A) HIT family hydrolase